MHTFHKEIQSIITKMDATLKQLSVASLTQRETVATSHLPPDISGQLRMFRHPTILTELEEYDANLKRLKSCEELLHVITTRIYGYRWVL